MIRVAPIASKAARFAVEHWHYSATMPVGRSTYFGVWEDDRYIGVVIFGRGASPHLGKQFGLNSMQLVELTRVALTTHVAPVSQIVTEAVRQLRARNAGLRVVVSFADPHHDHHGGIYQAMNWLYLGETAPTNMWRQPSGALIHQRSAFDGGSEPEKLIHDRHASRGGRKPEKLLHQRMVSRTGVLRQFGKRTKSVRLGDCEKIVMPGKHRYVLPLDRAMRRQLAPGALPYPQAHDTSDTRDAGRADESSMGAATLSGAVGRVRSPESAHNPMEVEPVMGSPPPTRPPR